MLSNSPKGHLTFRLILKETLTRRIFENHPICSHCISSQKDWPTSWTRWTKKFKFFSRQGVWPNVIVDIDLEGRYRQRIRLHIWLTVLLFVLFAFRNLISNAQMKWLNTIISKLFNSDQNPDDLRGTEFGNKILNESKYNSDKLRLLDRIGLCDTWKRKMTHEWSQTELKPR